MKRPEKQPNIMTENLLRPSLDIWTRSLPRDPMVLSQFSTELFIGTQNLHSTACELLAATRKHSDYVEPVDPALGKDPLLRRMGAFSCGTAVGLVVSAPIILQRPSSLRAAVNYTKSVINPELERVSGSSESELAYERGSWIINKGGESRSLFCEANTEIDDLADSLVADVELQIYAKAGAGIVLCAIWQGYKTVEMQLMMELASNMHADNPDLDTELATLMGNS